MEQILEYMKIHNINIPNNAKIYSCGPTVYQIPHIGNYRPILLADILFRCLENAQLARNITDIDDKIIEKANDIQSVKLFTENIINDYHKDLKLLGVRTPTFEPRATEYINHIIDIIHILLEKGFAYIKDDGNVLFNVRKYKDYGCISKKNINANITGYRKIKNIEKNNDIDFVLWKSDKNFWPTPWGIVGRPGWHIECSAMISGLFNSQIDVHCGGSDLIFPHHENESAQSCCAFDYKYLSKVWLHNEMITVSGEKMSKSKNNIIMLREILEYNHSSTIRVALLSANYSKTLDWNNDLLKNSKKRVNEFYRFISCFGVDRKFTNEVNPSLLAIHDNLNTTLSFDLLHEEIKKYRLGSIPGDGIMNTLDKLGILDTYREDIKRYDTNKINKQFDLYRKYKEINNYIEADKIRNSCINIEIHKDRWNIIDC